MTISPCPACAGKRTYALKDGRLECASCQHRFSLKQRANHEAMLHAFLAQHSPKKAATMLGLSLPTTQKYYSFFRQLLIQESERFYYAQAGDFKEYEEYLFLPKSKTKAVEKITEGIGIMGLSDGHYVYTVLMPDQMEIYTDEMRTSAQFTASFSSYYQWHKIAKLQSRHTPLARFWPYLEAFMLRFYGVKRGYFSEYLKEAEFRFNYTAQEQKRLLQALWRRHETKLLRAKKTKMQAQPL